MKDYVIQFSDHLLIPIFLLGIAWILDCALGEPKRHHPLVIYGKWVNFIEKRLHKGKQSTRRQGVIALALALTPIIPFVSLEFLLPISFYLLLATLAIYVTMSYRGLHEHAMDVYDALRYSNLDLARTNLAKIVSRDTSDLSETEITSACIESVLENGSDAIFAPWFWWLLCGLPGVILYRMINTLDAMWGYKNEKYYFFGWAAARLDDIANIIPARTTALCYSLAGNWKQGLLSWRTQGTTWKSPNAGPVMAAGAGSLNIKLGGAASYHGTVQTRPELGSGNPPQTHDIVRSLKLVRNAMWLWLGLATVLFLLIKRYTHPL